MLSSDIEISSMEEIQSFNVFEALMSELSEDERIVIKQLYDQRDGLIRLEYTSDK